MSEIILVRHAETDKKGTFCGHSDPPLNSAGREQIAGIFEAIGEGRVDAVLSSDLCRARETAEPIAARYAASIEFRPGLREIYFGAWEGLRWQEIERRDPQRASAWLQDFPEMPAPGGEAISAFRNRVDAEFEYLHGMFSPSAKRIVVVSHAGVLRRFLELGGESPQDAYRLTASYGAVIPYAHPDSGRRGRPAGTS